MLPRRWGQTPCRPSFPVWDPPNFPPTSRLLPQSNDEHQSQLCSVVVVVARRKFSRNSIFSDRVSENVLTGSKLCCTFGLSCSCQVISLSLAEHPAAGLAEVTPQTFLGSRPQPEQCASHRLNKKRTRGGGGAKCQRVLRLRLICTFHTCARFYFLPFVS